jgi:diacylglycerol O-acyltransferase
MPRPLSLPDEVIARHTSVPPVFGVLVTFHGQPPTLQDLRRRVTARWSALPRLRRVLVPTAGQHRWHVPGSFTTEQHVHVGASVSRVLNQDLPSDLPPWQLHVVPGDNEFTLLLRLHHSLADSRSLMILTRRLADDSTWAPRPRNRPARSDLRRLLDGTFGRGTAFDTPTETRPERAWELIDTRTTQAARHALPGPPATTSDVVLAAVAGALRARFGDPGGRVFAHVSMDRSTVQNADELGNLTTSLRVPLPVHETTPFDRLAASRGLMGSFSDRALKAPWHLLRAVSLLGTGALDKGLTYGATPPQIVATCTSLSWGPEPLVFNGNPATQAFVLPPVPHERTSFFLHTRYGDTSAIALATQLAPGDAQVLADGFADEVAHLGQLVRR